METRKSFKRGDVAWAKNRDDWLPAVVSAVSQSDAEVIFIMNEDMRKQTLKKGKTIPLVKLRKWGCDEYDNMMEIGENIADFDNAVAVLKNFWLCEYEPLDLPSLSCT